MTEESRQPRGAPAKNTKSTASRPAAASPQSDRLVMRARPDRYLVAGRAIFTQLEQDEACRVVQVMRGQAAGFPDVAVVEMPPEHAAVLASYPGIHIEPDLPADCGQPGPAVITQRVTFEVMDDGKRPVDGAAVTMTGAGFPVTGFTSADGHAEITVTPQTLADPAVAEIRPARGCWPVRVRRPLLNRTVRVTCQRITTTHPDFPERALDSWGARVMGFGRLPPTYRGQGVRIALIDSGAATGHPDLSGQVEHGRYILGEDEKSWQEDLIGTGTHHATLIAGRDDGTGIVGLSPEAELHICRVAPGGSARDLIAALDYCVEQRVDLAMFGTGIAGYSPLLGAKVDEAWRAGIACIAAATGGYPAALPQVLTVGAIGQLGTFPPEGTDTAELTGPVTAEGFFVPRFSPPGADCCAPGVAIISGLPPSSYGPLSGTGTAAAHVTALGALILAHHPLFRAGPGGPVRDASRPAMLLNALKASCRPLPLLDPARTGAGVPDVAVALGVAPWGAYPPLTMPYSGLPLAGGGGGASLAPLTAAMRAAGLA
jgi:subtilisin family serine protease